MDRETEAKMLAGQGQVVKPFMQATASDSWESSVSLMSLYMLPDMFRSRQKVVCKYLLFTNQYDTSYQS